jgi:hypothetical protein
MRSFLFVAGGARTAIFPDYISEFVFNFDCSNPGIKKYF